MLTITFDGNVVLASNGGCHDILGAFEAPIMGRILEIGLNYEIRFEDYPILSFYTKDWTPVPNSDIEIMLGTTTYR